MGVALPPWILAVKSPSHSQRWKGFFVDGLSANRNVWSAASPQAKCEGCHGLVCANVYGLCWSGSLLARMECAALFSPLVIQSLETSSGYGFEERRVRPLCHLLIRQQTWQETCVLRSHY